ncbi:MAG: SAM-dependent methyltransferase [Hyphomicrobiaceae bacterium]|jgi:SAM-dependent methyltransferase
MKSKNGKGLAGLGMAVNKAFKRHRALRILVLCIPPIIIKIFSKAHQALLRKALPALPEEFAALPFAQHGLFKLVNDYDFDSVLDVGAGAGHHSNLLAKNGKAVTSLDFGASIYAKSLDSINEGVTRVEANFYEVEFDEKFDCLWASHVLEHQPDPGQFLRRCMDLTREGGIIAITVPPLDHEVCGGHLTAWNAGLVLYQMVFNGIDCSRASICSLGYNTTVIVYNDKRPRVDLAWDNGDIRLLKQYFPEFVTEPFDGHINQWNW